MSTTTPSGSSASLRNVASTTYVAPCSRCAGPKTSPLRLWATIMWSRTVTLNMAAASAVRDRVTEGRERSVGEARHHLGQLLERRLPCEHRVERGVAQQ